MVICYAVESIPGFVSVFDETRVGNVLFLAVVF